MLWNSSLSICAINKKKNNLTSHLLTFHLDLSPLLVLVESLGGWIKRYTYRIFVTTFRRWVRWCQKTSSFCLLFRKPSPTLGHRIHSILVMYRLSRVAVRISVMPISSETLIPKIIISFNRSCCDVKLIIFRSSPAEWFPQDLWEQSPVIPIGSPFALVSSV